MPLQTVRFAGRVYKRAIFVQPAEYSKRTRLMTLKIKVSAAIVAASIITTPSATAQQASSEAGKVIEIGGPLGSVIVLRGAQSYALQTGDLLFDGDRVFTRSNGTAKLVANGCERSLDPAASLVIDKEVCKIAPITLAGGEAAIAAQIASEASAAGAALGSTPAVLGLLAEGGAVAAAATAGTVVD